MPVAMRSLAHPTAGWASLSAPRRCAARAPIGRAPTPRTLRGVVRVQAAAGEEEKDKLLPPPPEDATPSDGEVVPLEADRMLPATDSRFKGMKAFVAGASGRTGREVVRRLAGEGVPVRAFVRDAVKAVSVLPGLDKGVELVEGDVYDYQTIPEAMAGCDVVICATGASAMRSPLEPFQVDYEGTCNLIAAAQRAGVKKFVLVSSIGVDELLSPFNLFAGLAFWKKQAEQALQRSGLQYTIVRPGGLRGEGKSGGGGGSQKPLGGVVMAGGGEFGLLPGKRFPKGAILRTQVADCCVEALVEPSAANKVVELVTEQGVPNRPYSELFASVLP